MPEMRARDARFLKVAGSVFAFAGITLWGYICFHQANYPAWGMFLFAMLPYGICVLVAALGRPFLGVFGMGGAVAGDCLMYYSVFITPESSTSGIATVMAPFVSLFIYVPIGMVVGSFFQEYSALRGQSREHDKAS